MDVVRTLFYLPPWPGSSQAATSSPKRHTGHVPEVRETPAHRGAVRQDPKSSQGVWCPWRFGGATAVQTRGAKREVGKLGK